MKWLPLPEHKKYMKILRCLLPLLLLSLAGYAEQYTGYVIDHTGNPVYGAMVRLQGTSNSTKTIKNGYFSLRVDEIVTSNHITAWKRGYYNGAEAISKEKTRYEIQLFPYSSVDNPAYQWLPSTRRASHHDAGLDGENRPCQACHPEIVEEWQKDVHSGAAQNPVFLSFYNGTDVSGENRVAPGYKIDFKNANGNCATCHVPVMALNHAFNPDVNDAQGIEKEGIFCDFCHKIEGVTVDNTGGYPGILSYRFRRPVEGHQLFFGPFDDVYPGEDSYHPLYSKSHYCAPCHHGKFWDVLAYSEFQEWLDSSYCERNIHCQDCHMKSEGNLTRFALEKSGGISRDPLSIPSHVNFGVSDEKFMRDAISMKTTTANFYPFLKVTVTIENTNAGHHYPTGSPMRNMILLVEVRDASGSPMAMTTGERVPSWGGSGSKEEGNYSGLPGKGFAKVLKDAVIYPDKRLMHFVNEYPAPHWRPVSIASDNRIPADGRDVSSYQFRIPENVSWPISITTRLLFRRTYKKWLDAKGLALSDMEIARENLDFVRGDM